MRAFARQKAAAKALSSSSREPLEPEPMPLIPTRAQTSADLAGCINKNLISESDAQRAHRAAGNAEAAAVALLRHQHRLRPYYVDGIVDATGLTKAAASADVPI